MTKARLCFFTFILIISGIVGGALSSQLVTSKAFSGQYPVKLAAHSFELVDDQGKVRAGMAFAADGPIVYFNDDKGKMRAYLGTSKSGPILMFRHPNSEPAAMMNYGRNGDTSIGLYDGRNQPRLFISNLSDEGPSIGLFDNNNKVKVFVAVNKGNPSVSLLDQDKKPAIAMLNRKGEGSILSIWNSNHDPAVSLAVKGDKPGLFMYQQPRTGLIFNLAGGRPALALMDHGNPVWSATGDVPPAPELPPTDDIMREIMR